MGVNSVQAAPCLDDRDCANSVWGNSATWGQAPAPPANHFNFPIPIGMGARAIGMGEAFTALSDELSGIWYNPAGLTQMDKNEIYWMGGDRLVDVPFTGFFAASYILQNHMVFALSYQRPFHPTGAFPDLIAGTYNNFSKWTGSGSPTLTIPGVPGQRIRFSDITDTAIQDFLKKAYRAYINTAFQENAMVFTYATPLSPDQMLSMGINVKYLVQDQAYAADKVLLNEVGGWGLDMGLMYRIPLRRYGREWSFGLNLRDIAGQVRFTGGLGTGREVTLAPITTFGTAWKTNEYFSKSKLNLAMDFIYVNDPAFDDNANRRLYLGGEMWFFKDRIAPRMGYSMLFNRQLSRPSMGISFRYLVGLDYAFLFPGENEEATHWFNLNYRWGGIRKQIPTPDVSVTVDPPIFAPRRGEFATFTLKADAPNGVERWSVTIIDRNNMVVKVYQDRGEPPSQIIWGGEDKVYRPLPDGEYTYLFSATDNEGASSSTPVQTLKMYTPREPEVARDSVDALMKLIKDQEVKEEAQDDLAQADAKTALTAVLTKKDMNQGLVDVAIEPVAPVALTPLAEARADAGAFSYPRVDSAPFVKSGIQNGLDGKPVFNIDYTSREEQPRFILRDIADLAKRAAEDAGLAVARYQVTATYGSRQIRLIAPASSVLSLQRGHISSQQFLETSAITLDGAPLSPAYR